MYACLHAAGNRELLVECARQFSPLFEETAADAVLVDLRGLGLLFGSAEEIATAIVNTAGIPVNVAIADDPDTASFAARGFRGMTIVPAARKRQIIAPLPINLLGGSPETAAVLDAWGIRTFGEFAALPPVGIAARLGSEGTYLQKLAKGEGRRQLRPVEDPLRFEEELELDSPVELLEPLSFLLARLLGDLCIRLASRALSADEVNLWLQLENAAAHECALRLPLPIRDPKVFLKLLQLELSSRPPAAPIVKIRIGLRPEKPRTEQHNLFRALAPEPAKLEITLAKLGNLLGVENIGTPELLDTHRPDSFRLNKFTVLHKAGSTPFPATPALVLRRYRPAKYAQVILKDQQPAYVSALSLREKVLSCMGPWRLSGDWWKGEPWDRAEWDIALSDGALYRLREDLRTSRWYLEGVYD